MTVRTPLAVGALLLTAVVGTGVAQAQPVEPYSGGAVLGGTQTRNNPIPAVSGSSSQLPFTGSEVALVGLVAAASLAGGTALVVAGRRRRA